jgi:class 3 adenylate cyclase
MKSLPTGTVTFLFTDIEGSTALLQRLGDHRYAEVLEEHRRLLRDAFAKGHGQEIGTHGDAFLYIRRGDYARALAQYKESLIRSRETANRWVPIEDFLFVDRKGEDPYPPSRGPHLIFNSSGSY